MSTDPKKLLQESLDRMSGLRIHEVIYDRDATSNIRLLAGPYTDWINVEDYDAFKKSGERHLLCRSVDIYLTGTVEVYRNSDHEVLFSNQSPFIEDDWWFMGDGQCGHHVLDHYAKGANIEFMLVSDEIAEIRLSTGTTLTATITTDPSRPADDLNHLFNNYISFSDFVSMVIGSLQDGSIHITRGKPVVKYDGVIAVQNVETGEIVQFR